jgi:hypothetical protein
MWSVRNNNHHKEKNKKQKNYQKKWAWIGYRWCRQREKQHKEQDEIYA